MEEDVSDLTESSLNETVDCSVEFPPDRRWYMVALAGTSLSVVSLVCNLLIARVLFRSRHSHFFFLALLALSDSFLSICYGPVIAMEVIKDRLQLLWLTKLYLWYVGPLLSLCQVSMTFSCYLIILATIERFLITEKSRHLKTFRRNRKFLAAFMLVVSLFLRGTLIFEITIAKNEPCTGLSEWIPSLSQLVYTWLYGTVFRFYVRNITTVFVPFFLLFYLNVRIVRTLRRQQRAAEMFRFATSEHKVKTRSASRLMVMIVSSYLLANVLNIGITTWEYINFDSTQTYFHIYETCTDIISVLYIFVCATRLAVYVVCNAEIRNSVNHELRVCLCLRPLPHYGGVSSSSTKGMNEPRGTNIDVVAVAIARRLMSVEPPLGDESPSSPMTAIVFANHCNATNGAVAL